MCVCVCVCVMKVCVLRPPPVLCDPRRGPPLPPRATPLIGSLSLIRPAEPCKAPFVPSCRPDLAGDRLSSLDWLSVSQPWAVLVQEQAPAKPPSNRVKEKKKRNGNGETEIRPRSEHSGRGATERKKRTKKNRKAPRLNSRHLKPPGKPPPA